MRRIFSDKRTAKTCHILSMLKIGACKAHVSFHTPGHKRPDWDITELSYSDNLSAPSGCILQAQTDVARLVGAKQSFFLTDGSTAGVLSMLHALKQAGIRRVAFALGSHKSVYNGCALLGLTPFLFQGQTQNGVPLPLTEKTAGEEVKNALENSDALLLTSPDYYGNVADLAYFSSLCKKAGKPLVIDGAHGGHLRFEKRLYAGSYADMWVDGAHKSLPALTQGAIVHAKTEEWSERLQNAVDVFRTTSPSYPIMASVEYAVKYLRNLPLEKAVADWKAVETRLYSNQDWTKVCALFGKHAFTAEKDCIKKGVYPEFCDGNVVTFYLSPATKTRDFKRLQKLLKTLFKRYPYEKGESGQKDVRFVRTPTVIPKNTANEWLELAKSVGKICANTCGLFPPCTPLITRGERITEEKIELLQRADNVFGLRERKINVFLYEEEA